MRSTSLLTEGDITFRDLNKNGRLDPYEDPRRPIDERVEDLLAQMTLEEKAGLMFHTIAGVNPDGSMAPPPQGFMRTPIAELVAERLMNHFNVHALPAPRLAATWHNRLQELAEGTRLGIPVTISSDPRHAFSNNPLTSFRAAGFSQWPEPIGLAATGDPALVEEFGDIARQEYVVLGIRVSLHPMADLATEPRWARINGTFGEDAKLSARLTGAYIRGFQGPALSPASVACMTKHFPGGGPQKDGEDPHFPYGKEQVYPGNNFDYHLIPFDAAFAAGTAQIRGGRVRLQQADYHRPLARALRLRRRGLHRLGAAHRLGDRRASYGGARLGCRAPEPPRARQKGDRGRCRPVRR